jgi:hypothetical protein
MVRHEPSKNSRAYALLAASRSPRSPSASPACVGSTSRSASARCCRSPA